MTTNYSSCLDGSNWMFIQSKRMTDTDLIVFASVAMLAGPAHAVALAVFRERLRRAPLAGRGVSGAVGHEA